jgi:hypothetical protein
VRKVAQLSFRLADGSEHPLDPAHPEQVSATIARLGVAAQVASHDEVSAHMPAPREVPESLQKWSSPEERAEAARQAAVVEAQRVDGALKTIKGQVGLVAGRLDRLRGLLASARSGGLGGKVLAAAYAPEALLEAAEQSVASLRASAPSLSGAPGAALAGHASRLASLAAELKDTRAALEAIPPLPKETIELWRAKFLGRVHGMSIIGTKVDGAWGKMTAEEAFLALQHGLEVDLERGVYHEGIQDHGTIFNGDGTIGGRYRWGTTWNAIEQKRLGSFDELTRWLGGP